LIHLVAMDLDIVQLFFVGFYKLTTVVSAVAVAFSILGLSPARMAETVVVLGDRK
jgi:hypothetical protein